MGQLVASPQLPGTRWGSPWCLPSFWSLTLSSVTLGSKHQPFLPGFLFPCRGHLHHPPPTPARDLTHGESWRGGVAGAAGLGLEACTSLVPPLCPCPGRWPNLAFFGLKSRQGLRFGLKSALGADSSSSCRAGGRGRPGVAVVVDTQRKGWRTLPCFFPFDLPGLWAESTGSTRPRGLHGQNRPSPAHCPPRP